MNLPVNSLLDSLLDSPLDSIYLDIDGVMNAWQLYQLRLFGVEIQYDDWTDEFGWDIVKVYNTFSGDTWTEDDFWSRVYRQDWATAPKSEIFDLLLLSSEQLVGRDNTYVLTSPTRDPDSAAGKMEWIHSVLPPWLHRKVMIGSPKHIASQPGRLLIDDADHNCEAWEAKGGTALLVPRPWNKNRDKHTVSFVAEELGKLYEVLV